jgi:hypothetical protein
VFSLIGLISQAREAFAVEFEQLGKAVAGVLGTTKAFKKTIPSGKDKVDVFYAKDGSGKASKYAFIEKGIYEPNCTHTWVIGVDARTNKVEEIRVVEFSCQHAYPTRAGSYLDQYKGKGPADVKKLDSDIMTIAKATGSSKLTTDAVKRSIINAQRLKGKL